MPPHRGEVVVATAGHGREEASDEACSNRVKHCGQRYEGLTSNRKRELLNQMGEFGSRCGVSCAAANGENHVDVHY